VIGETVVILKPGTEEDPYSGETTTSWANPTETPVLALVPPEPRPSSEPVMDARNAVTSGWTIYLPTGTDVTAGDRIRVRGTVYDVSGEPAAWPDGLVLQATVTTG
jgi:head-tail adaptor